jgi:serine/threonine protein kinase
VGCGSFGKVFRAKTRDGEELALKIVDWTYWHLNIDDARPDSEALLMQQLCHQSVVRCFGHALVDHGVRMETWIVQEWCNGGTLHSHCIEPKSLRKTADVCADICAGGAYLHSMNIVHADLTAKNILLCVRDDGGEEKSFRCKIADFGMARMLSESTETVSSCLGTVTHMPPELFQIDESSGEHKLSTSIDVYSFGMVLYQVHLGKAPHASRSAQQVVVQVSRGRILQMPETAERPLLDMYKRSTCTDPDSRPTFAELGLALAELSEVAKASLD